MADHSTRIDYHEHHVRTTSGNSAFGISAIRWRHGISCLTMIQSVCVRVCLAIACCGSAAGQITSATNGHEPPYASNPANAPDALQKVQSGDYGPVHVHMLARFKVAEAIPVLEKQFALRQDQLMKAVIASAL